MLLDRSLGLCGRGNELTYATNCIRGIRFVILLASSSLPGKAGYMSVYEQIIIQRCFVLRLPLPIRGSGVRLLR